MTQHISTNQWMRFFSRKSNGSEKLFILQHVAECETCRALMDKANDFRFALDRQQKSDRLFFTDDMEYQTVAGVHPVPASIVTSGFLSVELIKAESGYLFSEDTLETSGIGNKFAMNCSEDHRKLSDDEDELSILIKGSQIIIENQNQNMHGSVHLLTELSDMQETRLTSTSQLTLPLSGPCELEIILEEG